MKTLCATQRVAISCDSMICSKNNNVLIDFNDAAVVDCEGNLFTFKHRNYGIILIDCCHHASKHIFVFTLCII